MKNSNKQTRTVKLHSKYRSLKNHWQGRYVPWLNISGVWLEQAGFHAGDPIQITIRENQLIINLAQDGDNGN